MVYAERYGSGWSTIQVTIAQLRHRHGVELPRRGQVLCDPNNPPEVVRAKVTDWLSLEEIDLHLPIPYEKAFALAERLGVPHHSVLNAFVRIRKERGISIPQWKRNEWRGANRYRRIEAAIDTLGVDIRKEVPRRLHPEIAERAEVDTITVGGCIAYLRRERGIPNPQAATRELRAAEREFEAARQRLEEARGRANG